MIDDKAVLQKCKERKMPIEATVLITNVDAKIFQGQRVYLHY
jgi:hypothetical protein